MTGTVQERQTVFDVALQYFGSAEACFVVAEKLGISITDTPTAGATFEYDLNEVVDRHVVNYYSKNGIIPTTEN